MPATVTSRTFSYDELSEEAKEVAREWYRDQLASDPMEYLHEQLDDLLTHEYGLDNCKLSYSLGYCQGDGVAFEGSPDIDEWAKHDPGVAARLAVMTLEAASVGAPWELSVLIIHEGRSSHCYSMRVDVELEDCGGLRNANPWEDWQATELDQMATELEEYLNEAVRKISRSLEKAGYDEIEYQQSDEVVAEFLSGYPYRFDEDGEFVE